MTNGPVHRPVAGSRSTGTSRRSRSTTPATPAPRAPAAGRRPDERLLGTPGAERIRVAEDRSGSVVGTSGDGLLPGRVDGPTGEAALERPDEERRLGQGALPVRGDASGRGEHAEVGRDGVEAAGVHDGRPGLTGPGVELVERPPDEEHLSGQVGVVRPGLGAGPGDLLAVGRIGTDGRGEDAGARGQVAQTRRVGRVDRDELPRRRRRTQLDPEGLELGPRTPCEGDPHAGSRVLGEVGGGQGPDEAGGAVEDDVELAIGHAVTLSRPRRGAARPVRTCRAGRPAPPRRRSPCAPNGTP